MTGTWATQWQWGWKERISTGDGLEEESGNSCQYLLLPAYFSKSNVIRSPPPFPAPGQELLQALGNECPCQGGASGVLSCQPGFSRGSLARSSLEGAFPSPKPRCQQLWFPDPFSRVLRWAPAQTSHPPNSPGDLQPSTLTLEPGCWLLPRRRAGKWQGGVTLHPVGCQRKKDTYPKATVWSRQCKLTFHRRGLGIPDPHHKHTSIYPQKCRHKTSATWTFE